MKPASLVALLVPLAFALGGCATAASPEAPPTLAGSSWILRDIGGTPVIDRSEAAIEFLDGQRASGNASCNRFTATYETAGGRIKFGPIATTRRACMGPAGEQEARFLKALDGAERVSAQGDNLLIHVRGGEPLRFVRKLP